MEMEQPGMECLGTIEELASSGAHHLLMTLPQLSQAEPNPCMGSQFRQLNIAHHHNHNNDNNGVGVDVAFRKMSDSEMSPLESVDARGFFGRKDKDSNKETATGGGGATATTTPQASGGADKEKEEETAMKFDDGDSKNFWGSGGGNKAMMPVQMDSEVYNMTHPKRGKAVIFNHENFHPQLDLGRRYGTEKDKLNLVASLKKLGFDVQAHDDLTYHEVIEKIDKLTKEDHTKHDCVLIAVLSHGEHQLLYAKDFSYKPDNLWQSFTAEKCPSLAGKPKIFLIQACQGSQLDEGVRLVRVSRTETDSSPQSYRIPNHADFLIAFSTVPGFYSWRNTTNGSWFMQAVCDVFNKYATKKDLLSMMTIVARMVALNFESNTPSQPHMNQKKQMPFITSTLIRDVYLTPK